jgi:hypothetical protein
MVGSLVCAGVRAGPEGFEASKEFGESLVVVAPEVCVPLLSQEERDFAILYQQREDEYAFLIELAQESSAEFLADPGGSDGSGGQDDTEIRRG